MKYELDIKNEKAYDAIVVGSGPAGIAAAITAGRLGARVLIIESCGRVGGISTAGMMSHFTGTVGNAIYEEVLNRANEKLNIKIPIALRKGKRSGFFVQFKRR